MKKVQMKALSTKSNSATALARFPSLHGKRVFVTGGGTGIGAAMVEAFAEQGAQIAFVDVAQAESHALAQKITDAGHTPPWWRVCDVRDVAALQQTIAQATAELGDFATLVNNVARDDRHTLESVTPDYWDERMAVNQRPAFFAIQSIVPGMKRLGGWIHHQFGLHRLAKQGQRLPLLCHC